MTPPGQSAPIGLIGLGLVGRALATRLTQAGYACLGHDVDATASERFKGEGHKVAASPRMIAAQCEVIILAVFDTQGVLEVLHGKDGVLSARLNPESGAESGAKSAHLRHRTPTLHTLIDCSTGDPEALQAIAVELEATGLNFIEAPLSGSSAQIAKGEATMLLGAKPEALQANEKLLEALAHARFHVGPAGMGAKAKLATNLVLGLNRAALAEGMVFAEHLGIAPARFLELVLASPARSDAALNKGPMMVAQCFEPQSRIRQHLKDVHLMLNQAALYKQGLPLSETHAALMQAALEAGDGELDNAAIIKQIRRQKARGS